MAARRPRFVVIIGVILALLVGACSSPSTPSQEAKAPAEGKQAQPAAAKQEKIVLSALSFLPVNQSGSAPLSYVVDYVNKRSNGELVIEFKGGPEVIGAFEQFEALKTGAIDMILNTDSYAKGVAVEFGYSAFSMINPPKEREVGIWDYWHKIYAEKLNTYYLGHPHGGDAAKMYIFTNQQVVKPADLTGQKIRSVPMYDPFLKALGVAPVTMPVAEIYTAVERKTIDGYAYPMYAGLQSNLKLAEVTKYVLKPGFMHTDTCLLMNMDKWNKLPKHLQDLLTQAAKDAELWAFDEFSKMEDREFKAAEAAGMKIVEFSPSDSKSFLDTLYKAELEDMIKELGPEKGNALFKLLTEGKK